MVFIYRIKNYMKHIKTLDEYVKMNENNETNVEFINTFVKLRKKYFGPNVLKSEHISVNDENSIKESSGNAFINIYTDKADMEINRTKAKSLGFSNVSPSILNIASKIYIVDSNGELNVRFKDGKTMNVNDMRNPRKENGVK